MNNYLEARIHFDPCNDTITDIASALLGEAGFESFVAERDVLTAYAPSKLGLTAGDITGVLARIPVKTEFTVETNEIEGRDWNREWEKNYFKPIVIADKCVVHSSFHSDVPKCVYDIVIDPKMAFGTGHHATTTLIMTRLLQMDLGGKNVLDMGTGTGILSILASMRGAESVAGVEIDEAAYVNAVENVWLNVREDINVIHGDASVLEAMGAEKFDLILANINRNVIIGDLPAYCKAVRLGGELVFSGFYEEDIPLVRGAAEECGLDYADHTVMDRWASVRFVKI